MAEILHYKGVLYPVGEEPEKLRNERMCFAKRVYNDGSWDYGSAVYVPQVGWIFQYLKVTHVGPMPEIEVVA